MPKTKISEFSATPGNNTDIDGINIAEGCPPSGINDAIRELMAQLKDFQAGTAGDSFNGPVGTTTPAAGVFTNLSASGTFALTGDQVQISEGGTGQTTANAAFNALAPSQSTHAGKYLKTDGTNTSWDAIDINTADITGTLPIANGGTGLTALGTGVQTALGIAVGSSGAFVTNGGALGTPSSGTVTNLTGTASININGTVGATTPTTGAFTTLSASGNITVSGGTANGVAYLNGSKVLTTGSALTFDGTNLTNAQSTASPTGLILDNSSASTSAGTRVSFKFGGSTTGYVGNQFDGADFNNQYQANRFHIWLNGASETMRLTSASLYTASGINVGIGLSNPAYKLDVNGNANIGSTSSVDTALFVKSSTVTGLVGAQSNYSAWSSGGLTTAMNIGTTTNNGISFGTNNIGRLNLDSSGNLGIAQVPYTSGFGSGSYGRLQVSTAALALPTGDSNVPGGYAYSQFLGTAGVSNWLLLRGTYNNASTKSGILLQDTFYDNNAYGGRYIQANGQALTFGLAVNGTVYSSNQTLTEHARIDASGNLGVGETSPSFRFHARAAVTGAYTTSTAQVVALVQNQPASLGSGVNSSFLRFQTSPDAGASNPIAQIGVVAESYGSNNGAFVVATRDGSGITERARITSGGDLLVGKTAENTTTVGIQARADGLFAAMKNDAVSGIFARGNSDGDVVTFRRDATAVGSISVTTTATAYNTSSDYRLKNIDGPLTGSGEFIDALKPKVGTWKTNGSKFVGFLAHEVQEVSPGSVVGTKDAVDEEGKPIMQAMEYGSAEFIANIIAELQSLRARVAQLEGASA